MDFCLCSAIEYETVISIESGHIRWPDIRQVARRHNE